MRTEKEIRDKIEFLDSLLNSEEASEFIVGTLARSKLRNKIDMLNWVLGEDVGRPRELGENISQGDVINDIKGKILRLFESNPDRKFTAVEVIEKVPATKQTIVRYLRELSNAGYLESRRINGIQGTPCIYKFKQEPQQKNG